MGQIVDGIERIIGAQATMRDGCVLEADIFRPVNQTRQLPVMLLRLPYDKRLGTETNYAPPSWYARQGFVVVVQDTRGRYASGGDFVPFVHEATDGYDTVQWAAHLEGSNGRVGMYGASYSGYLQLLTATTQPPALGAICPAIAGSDLYHGWLYEGGALSLSFAAWWAASLGLNMAGRGNNLDVEQRLLRAMSDVWRWYGSRPPYDLDPIGESIPFFREWLDHPQRDDYWVQRSAEAMYGRIVVPALHIGGWYDSFNEGTVRNFVQLSEQQSNQRLLVGPWGHVPWGRIVGSVDFGPEAAGSLVDHTQVAFLRHHLDPEARLTESAVGSTGLKSGSEKGVRYFVLFENDWRTAETWPPEGAKAQTWYLHSSGRANSASGDGWLDLEAPTTSEPADSYIYNPADPVRSIGGHSCCLEENAPMGAHDQSKLEHRNDILVYTSAPLSSDLVLAGPTRLQLWVQTAAPDADYTGKLCIVEGTSVGARVINIAEGIHRATAELSAESVDKPIAIEIELRNVAACIRAGQRLRLEVSGGSFPMYDINPQSGVPAARAGLHDFRPATHYILHNQAMASHLLITVLPDGEQ